MLFQWANSAITGNRKVESSSLLKREIYKIKARFAESTMGIRLKHYRLLWNKMKDYLMKTNYFLFLQNIF